MKTPAKNGSGAKSVSEIVADSGSPFGALLAQAKALSRLENMLREALGPECAQSVHAVSLHHGTLVLAVPAAALAAQLRRQEQTIKAVICERFQNDVQKIRIKIDPALPKRREPDPA